MTYLRVKVYIAYLVIILAQYQEDFFSYLIPNYAIKKEQPKTNTRKMAA